jgi:predicted metal-binding protein
MIKREELAALFKSHGYSDFKWIEPQDIIVSHWVRMKCRYGCPTYGRNASCPPNVPSVSECRQFFDEYSTAAIFHFAQSVEKPEDQRPWGKEVNRNLMKLEREVFLSGYQKAFLLFMSPCRLCSDCLGERSECNHPKSARPTPEGMAVDVFSTARQCGYPINVLSDYSQQMNRYAFLLIG